MKCRFCNLGCELDLIDRDNRKIISYKEPLCPRGNAIPLLLESENRLKEPIVNGKEANWEKALREVYLILKSYKGDEIAITFDIGLKDKDYALCRGFAKSFNAKNASSFLSEEYYLNYSIKDEKNAGLEDVIKYENFIVIGDIFSYIPKIAKYLIRKNLFVIDSYYSAVAKFSSKFVKVRNCTQSIFLMGLLSLKKEIDVDIDLICDVCQVDKKAILDFYKGLQNKDFLVIYGRWFFNSLNPVFDALFPRYFAKKFGFKSFCIHTEKSQIGENDFVQILKDIDEGKIKVLINFGDTLSYYQQLKKYFDKLEHLILIQTERTDLKADVILPLEVTRIISELSSRLNKKVEEVPSGKKEIKESELEEYGKEVLKGVFPDIICIDDAYGFRKVFTRKNRIFLSPTFAKKNGIRREALLKTSRGEFEVEVVFKDELESGIIVDTSDVSIRKFFEMMIDKDRDFVIFKIEGFKLCKK